MKKKLILTGLVSCLTIGSICSLMVEAQTDKKPIGIWKFEESEGVQVNDSSENGNNGKISNNMLNVKRTEGKRGMAVNFNLENKKYGAVVIQNIASKYAFFTKGITIEVWIKLNNTLKKEASYEIVSNTESDRGKGFRLVISNGILSFKSGEGGVNGQTWGANSKSATCVLKPEVWYHVAGVFDGSIFCVYLDGELVGQSSPGQLLTSGRKDIYIGSFVDGFAYGFDGIIDEVKIYDYPRTAVQILGDSKAE